MMKQLLRSAPAWSAAVLVTTALASIVQSWQVQSRLTRLGVEISPSLAAETAWRDFAGLALPLLLVFGLALLLGFALAGWLRVRLPLLAPLAWPLAGIGAVAATLSLMKVAMDITPLAGARGLDGFLLFCLAGALGGLVYAWLRPQ
ncbi:hypothetical protein [Sandarakinorhabdus rubra]|uniref:hypothetical protein n=1 Tax=Sandarakinorhabdus rubra TaxID=2672568 RepID=UPI0013DC7D70|nr:hypothetical protein [Sandarakinorhabdus rubra]